MRLRRLALWSTVNLHLNHNNVLAHSLHLILTFLAENQTHVVCQATDPPDIAPYSCWLFSKLKRPLKGKRFQIREDIMTTMTTELNTFWKRLSQNVSNNGGNVGRSVESQGGEVCGVPWRLLCGWLGSQRSSYAYFFPHSKVRYFSNRPHI